MKKISLIIVVFACMASAIFFALSLSADTIITNDGKEIKGIVVEDYKDRVVFSTVDGEISVMKSDIREMAFDSDEDNLIKLAEQASDKRDYSRAMSFYDMALKANPNSNAAKQGMAYLRGSIFRKEEEAKSADIMRQQDIETYGGQAPLRSKSGDVDSMMETLYKTTGMKIAIIDNAPKVESAKMNMPAYEAGVRKDDTIVSVWSKLAGYLSLKEILDLLISKSAIEIRCVIERGIDVNVNANKNIMSKPEDLIGAGLSMELDGLVISDVKDGGSAFEAGIKKGDQVMAIDGNPTRYMPLKKAIDLIKNTKSDTIKLTVRRKATIWRRSEL